MMGNNGRLIIFVDDLDRCEIDNVLDILSAVKLFLSAPGVIFVIAVDLTMVERAWKLKYQIGNAVEGPEGKDHVDKIFQLKLSLPPKDPKEIERYIANKALPLPPELRKLLLNGCPHNPRKIKRILNLIRYLVINSQDDNTSFNKHFPVLVIWSIITVAYPELATILKESPRSLTKLALIVNYLDQFEDLHIMIDRFRKPTGGGHVFLEDNLKFVYNPSLSDQKRSNVLVDPSTIRALQYADSHFEVFSFLKEIAQLYSIREDRQNVNDLTEALGKDYGGLCETLTHIIYYGGLIA